MNKCTISALMAKDMTDKQISKIEEKFINIYQQYLNGLDFDADIKNACKNGLYFLRYMFDIDKKSGYKINNDMLDKIKKDNLSFLIDLGYTVNLVYEYRVYKIGLQIDWE